MKYRRFGKTGIDISVLGFGTMRLPLNSGDSEDINEKKAIDLIRQGIDRGINYVDTAYIYHNGKSEALLAKALKDGYRSKVYVATKLSSWHVNTQEDMFRLFEEQLKELDMDCVDFYLLHYVNQGFWDMYTSNGVFEFLDAIKREGKAKYVGFSFHDGFDLFKEIVDSYDWDMCQIQLNYMDVENQAGVKGLKYAKEKGLGVSIMEPLRGGSLVLDPPEEVVEVWKSCNPDKSPVSWALDFLYNFDEVDIVLSGMNEPEHLQENLAIADESMPNKLTKKEIDTVMQVKEIYENRVHVDCTGCNYCLPCPRNVQIPGIFVQYNNSMRFNVVGEYGARYWRRYHRDMHAAMCTACGMCISKCPQKIDIVSELKGVVERFGDRPPWD